MAIKCKNTLQMFEDEDLTTGTFTHPYELSDGALRKLTADYWDGLISAAEINALGLRINAPSRMVGRAVPITLKKV